MNLHRNLESDKFDLLIIGGGITGLAILREATERGLRACLVEKNDYGWSTSGATSKLIHGGLRYLENYEFSLVRESLRERRILGLAAGHLVRPLSFLIPIFPWSHPGRVIMRAGLLTYDTLSFDRNHDVPDDKHVPGSRYLSRKEIIEMDPALDGPDTKCGFEYYDYQSLRPERLSLAFLKSAVEKGAVAYNHTEAVEFLVEKSGGRTQISGANVRDSITGKTATIRASLTINATGPWMDLVLGLFEDRPRQQLQRSKGIHLLTKPIMGKHSVLFRTRSGRHFFVIPWEGYSLIGPTDRPFEDHPDRLHPTQQDVDELAADVNETIPGAPLHMEDILHVPIGIRPLIGAGDGQQSGTYKASRKYEIYDHANESIDGLISVAGGKWTTSRQLGEDVILGALKKSELKDVLTNRADTSVLPLYGSPGFANPADIYRDFALKEYGMAGVARSNHLHLLTMYGTEHVEVLKLLDRERSLGAPVSKERPELDLLAQVVYAVQNEGARTLQDILMRRLAVGAYGPLEKGSLETVARTAGKYLKWSAARQQKEIKEYLKQYPLDLIHTPSGRPAIQLLGGKAGSKSSRSAATSKRPASKKKPSKKSTSPKKTSKKKPAAKKKTRTTATRKTSKKSKKSRRR
ncbi:MAG: glycerol-3-phosphate dehydrogenase/oxidase [Leptospiraceae bacterium]|nr:glycerol-3-phosphate dehydrogenase/oxidase [Leptospiraceae bacterium]